MPERFETVLVRHGQSTANASGVWQGQMNYPLSEEGRRQATYAGEALSAGKIDGVYSSPLSRTYETAEIIAQTAGFKGRILALSNLVERHGGILEGTTSEEREASNPELMQKFAALHEDERWSLVGAETEEEVLARFREAISEVRGRHEAGERVVVVSHGGVMRAFLRDYFGSGVLDGYQRAPNASITRISWEPNEAVPQLLELASTRHLPYAGESTTSE